MAYLWWCRLLTLTIDIIVCGISVITPITYTDYWHYCLWHMWWYHLLTFTIDILVRGISVMTLLTYIDYWPHCLWQVCDDAIYLHWLLTFLSLAYMWWHHLLTFTTDIIVCGISVITPLTYIDYWHNCLWHICDNTTYFHWLLTLLSVAYLW